MVSYSANASVEVTMHGTSISHDSSSDVPNCVDDPNTRTDTMVKSVRIEDLRDGQEHKENDKTEVAPVPQRNNASFQKMFMRSLSSKVRWSKKQVCTHQGIRPCLLDHRTRKTLDIDWFLHQMIWSMSGRSCKTARRSSICLVQGKHCKLQISLVSAYNLREG